MVNFMCKLDRTTGCPDICLNIILGVFVKVFLNETSIWISRLSKADCPPQCGWAPPNQLKTWTEQKYWVRGILPAWLVELGHWHFKPLDSNWKIGLSWISNLLILRLEPTLFCISGLYTWTGTIALAFLGLQLVSIIVWPSNYLILFLSLTLSL